MRIVTNNGKLMLIIPEIMDHLPNNYREKISYKTKKTNNIPHNVHIIAYGHNKCKILFGSQ